MARRELEEINAGSMADIAFLLLIFFIVTTTMDLEAGVSQTLNAKVEAPDGYVPPDVNERNIFSISINSKNEFLVEQKSMVIEEIKENLRYYFSANLYSLEADETQAFYNEKNTEDVKQALGQKKAELALDEGNIILKSDVSKLEKTLLVCNTVPGGRFNELDPTAAIQLKQKAATSYGTYMAVLNVIGEVIYELRDEKCKEIFNGISYKDLDPTVEEDKEKLRILGVIIPRRLFEPEIKN